MSEALRVWLEATLLVKWLNPTIEGLLREVEGGRSAFRPRGAVSASSSTNRPHAGRRPRATGHSPARGPRYGTILSKIGAFLAPWLTLAGGMVAAAGGAESSDARFLAGLRERQLYELAAGYCRRQLEGEGLEESAEVALVVELARTLAEQAAASPPAARPALWDEAGGVLEGFLARRPHHPRAVLVRYQGALVRLARGELARAEGELLAADRERHFAEAREELREAAATLRSLRAAARESLPGGLSDQERISLDWDIQYQLARALRNQARAFPADSPDRAHALTQAVELLGPLSRLDDDHPLAWPSRLEAVECYRLLADLDSAERYLEAIEQTEGVPAEVVLRARAERIHLALDRGDVAGAVERIGTGEREGAISAELDLARLSACLAAWQAADENGEPDEADRWRQHAGELVQRIEGAHGPLWSRRAGLLLAGTARRSSASSDVTMLAHAAEGAYRSGEIDEALAAYDRAAELAAAEGKAERAFELRYAAAAIEHRREGHAAARRRFRELAEEAWNRPEAPPAHLLAVYHAAQLARSDPARIDDYAALLQEHLRIWPQSPTADSARWQLGRLRQLQGDWQNAIAAYRGIGPGAAEFPAAVSAVTACYRRWLADVDVSEQSPASLAEDAAGWLESLAEGHSITPDLARQALLDAVRIRLAYAEATSGPPAAALAAALSGAPDASAEWRSAAAATLAVVHAVEGDFQRAAAVLDEAAENPAVLVEVMEQLAGLAPADGSAPRQELAALRLRVAEHLAAAPLAPPLADRFARLHARTLADAGRSEEALSHYERIVRAGAAGAAEWQSYAELLERRGDRASLEAALDAWRKVEQQAPRGSDTYYRARYAVASLHARAGNTAQALRMISLLRVLDPDLGGPEWRPRFEQLLDRLRAPE